MAHTCFALLEISVVFTLIHLSSVSYRLISVVICVMKYWARGERRANQELLQNGSELFWNNILSKVKKSASNKIKIYILDPKFLSN